MNTNVNLSDCKLKGRRKGTLSIQLQRDPTSLGDIDFTSAAHHGDDRAKKKKNPQKTSDT